MAAPRHLWSGDWRRESADAANDLARRRGSTGAPSEPPAPKPLRPQPSALERVIDALRRAIGALAAALGSLGAAIGAVRNAKPRRVRGPVLMGLAMLLSAGVAYAAVSALVTSDTTSSAGTHHTSLVSSAPAWLGVDTTSFPLTSGALVIDVAPGSPADAAGLEPGDIITEIGRHPVQTPADVDSAVASLRAGQQVQIGYQRGPSTSTTQVTLQARPASP